MAFDSGENRFYFLDPTSPRVLSFNPDFGIQVPGQITAKDGIIEQINLSQFKPGTLNGIAFNSSNNHLYVFEKIKTL